MALDVLLLEHSKKSKLGISFIFGNILNCEQVFLKIRP